jgi:hypothetical protein
MPETPRKAILKKCIKQQRVHLSRLRKRLLKKPSNRPIQTASSIANSLPLFLSGSVLQLVKAQLILSQRHKNGYRWQGENKSLYMSMYYRSARLYRFC